MLITNREASRARVHASLCSIWVISLLPRILSSAHSQSLLSRRATCNYSQIIIALVSSILKLNMKCVLTYETYRSYECLIPVIGISILQTRHVWLRVRVNKRDSRASPRKVPCEISMKDRRYVGSGRLHDVVIYVNP